MPKATVLHAKKKTKNKTELIFRGGGREINLVCMVHNRYFMTQKYVPFQLRALRKVVHVSLINLNINSSEI